MKEAVVIGALGFVGYGLCCRLLDEGVFIDAVDLPPCDNSLEEEKMLQIGRNANYQFIDLNSEDGYEQTLGETDALFFSLLDLKEREEITNDSQRKLEIEAELIKAINYCESSGSKLVIISSSEVNEERKSEDIHFEQIVNTYKQTEPFNYSIIRLPMIYGPWQPENRSFQRAINSIIRNEEFTVQSSDFASDILYIDDAVNEIIKIVKDPEAKKTSTLSSGIKDSWVEGLKIIFKERFKQLSIEKINNQKTLEDETQADVRILKTLSLRDGIKKQYDYAKWLNKRFK